MLLFVLFQCLLGVTLASPDNQVILTKLRAKVEMECEGDDIFWRTKSNQSATEFMDLPAEGNTVEDNTLILTRLSEDQLGVYSCFDSDDNIIKTFKVEVRFKIKKMPQSVYVNLGGPTLPDEIVCSTLGKHDVIFRWYTRPEGSEEDSELTQLCGVEGDNCKSSIEPSDPQLSEIKENEVVTKPPPFIERISISTSKGSLGYTSELKIDNAQMEDRAVYVCRAFAKESENDEDLICSESPNCEEVSTLLRVKDPLAAIWPFIGIVAEVVSLCLVIFFCERRRKAEEAKEDMEEDGYAGNNISSNNSLRQRK